MLERHCELWEEERGVRVSITTMRRAVRKLSWIYKKSLAATERDEGKRRAWHERLRDVDPRRLIFVDKCSPNVRMVPLRARAPKGERALGKKAPRNWKENVTLISSISLAGGGWARLRA